MLLVLLSRPLQRLLVRLALLVFLLLLVLVLQHGPLHIVLFFTPLGRPEATVTRPSLVLVGRGLARLISVVFLFVYVYRAS